MMSTITGISDLESDPYLHGAGLHAYPHNGKLDLYLDYIIHPVSGKERRVNLIIYLNKGWRDDYGGYLQLWNADMSECKSIITPSFNSAVLFRTTDISYHGIPYPLKCPLKEYRKSMTIYYIPGKLRCE
jgi:Rps23 Pro-64 3,4-dihydroxylase Tpa1-like proline 4-hydroxylase